LDTGREIATLRVMVKEAAARVGVTETAIRKRIQRGSLSKELGDDGRAYVYLDLSRDMTHPMPQVDNDLLVEDSPELFHYRRELGELRDDRVRRLLTSRSSSSTETSPSRSGRPSYLLRDLRSLRSSGPRKRRDRAGG
jgi:hypothetical protein